MQVHSSSPYSILASHSQLPYNPDMFASAPAPAAPQSPQYTLQPDAPQPGSEDMFFALERLLMGISPFPPSIPTLAKPTCPPSLDDQLMAEISSTTAVPSATSPIPSIVLNEQSLDLLQQFYQSRDSTQMTGAAFQLPQYESSDCSSSTSRSASPPSSPYSYTSSLVSSPAMPVLDSNANASLQDSFWLSSPNGFVQQQQQQQQPQSQEWDISLFEQMSLPLTMTDLENYVAPATTSLDANSYIPTVGQHSLKAASAKRIASAAKKAHHRRTSSVCSALSAYEAPAALREHRASSISSVSSNASSAAATAAATAAAVAAVAATSGMGANSRVKSYACPTCTKPFPTRTQLKSHMAIHTDSFPFPCLYAGCELHFKRKHDLRRHVDAKHALVKKYICTGGCGEGFGRRDQMVRHLRRGTCGQAGFQTE